MRLISLELESKLRQHGLWPQSWIAWAAFYVLSLDLLLFAVQWMIHRVRPATSTSLEGWVIFLSGLAIVLFALVGFRWLRSQLLWRLRNRLIVTYVFIGVIPVFLLVVISLITLYLLAGQFASFVVTSDITTHLRGMEASNRAIAHHLANKISEGGKLDPEILGRTRPHRPEWVRREVCAWYRNQPQPYCSGPGRAGLALIFLHLSPATSATLSATMANSIFGQRPSRARPESAPSSLRVILSEPFDQEFVENIAADLGRITVYGNAPPNTENSRRRRSRTSCNPEFPSVTEGRANRPFPREPFHRQTMRSITKSL